MKHANIAIFVPHNGCPNTCAFCNQRTISGEQKQPSADDVRRAAERALETLGDEAKNGEIAFFGGSFTAIERSYMISLLSAAAPYVQSGRIGGIRCSTRPDCIDSEVLEILKGYGVTAIELGAQSMDDRVLQMNQRGHTAQDVRDAAALIKQYGIELGLQMMTGLYGDSDEGALYTARELAALKPATVRIYPTVVLRGTRLAELYEAGEYIPQDVEGAVNICASLLTFFEERGIAVIRLGLHASRDVENEQVAGAYHPAMRELCESRIFLEKAATLLKEKTPAGQDGQIILQVNPSDISKMAGQRRSNIEQLLRMGYNVKIQGCRQMEKGSVAINQV